MIYWDAALEFILHWPYSDFRVDRFWRWEDTKNYLRNRQQTNKQKLCNETCSNRIVNHPNSKHKVAPWHTDTDKDLIDLVLFLKVFKSNIFSSNWYK